MIQIKYTATGNLFNNPHQRVMGAIEKGITNASGNIQSLYQKDTPVRTGFLRSQWSFKLGGRNTSEIYNDASYAKYIFSKRATLNRNERKAKSEVVNSIGKEIERALQ